MTAYYNEIDPHAAEWLRELIRRGLIADGIVDTRSIEDVTPLELREFAQCHFFAGIGGWSLALRQAGWPDDRPVWTGSCPCQPFSAAGEGAGFADERHLWPAFFWLIRHGRPAAVFGEQVASPAGLQWLDAVRADLEAEGYAFGAADLCAAGVGAPHIRQRLCWVGHAHGARLEGHPGHDRSSGGPAAARPAPPASVPVRPCDWVECRDGKRRPVEPGTFPLAHGVPARMVRLRGYGNAIHPEVAAAFVRASA